MLRFDWLIMDKEQVKAGKFIPRWQSNISVIDRVTTSSDNTDQIRLCLNQHLSPFCFEIWPVTFDSFLFKYRNYLFISALRAAVPPEKSLGLSAVTCFLSVWSAGLSGGDFTSSLPVKSDPGITCNCLCCASLHCGLTSSMGICSGLVLGGFFFLGPLSKRRGCSTHGFWFWWRWLCIFFLCFLQGVETKEQI